MYGYLNPGPTEQMNRRMNQTLNQPTEIEFTVRLEALEGLGLNLGLMIYEAHGVFGE